MPFPYTFPFTFDWDRPEVRVEIAFGSNAFADTPVWDDVSADVRSYHFSKGRVHELDRMSSGSAEVVLYNDSGDYWPDKPAPSPWAGEITAGKRIRISCQYLCTWYIRFVGYIDEWIPGWLDEGGQGPIMTVTATDGLECLANLLLNDGSGYIAEASHTRVENVLTTLGWPAADRDLKSGSVSVIATGALANINARDHLQKVQDAELGILFVAFDGDMTFHARTTRTTAPYATSSATFGDDPGEFPYVNITTILDRSLLYNQVRGQRDGGTEMVMNDTTSQDTYGKRCLSKPSLLLANDEQVEVLCNFLLAKYKDAIYFRAKSIDILPNGDTANLYPKVFSYDISTRITVRLDAASLDREFFIEGIEESASALDGNWKVSWQLGSVDKELAPPVAQSEVIWPNAAGDETNCKKTAATNWQSVITNPPTQDVYDDLDVAGVRDLYNLATPDYASGTINSVTVTVLIQVSVANSTAQFKTAIKTGGTVYESDVQTPTDTLANYYSKAYTTNPNTSAAWTWAEIALLQAGVWLTCPLVAGFPSGQTQCQQEYVTINYTPTWT